MVISMHSKCRGGNTSSAVVFHYQSCLHDLCDGAWSLPLSLWVTLSGLMHERDLHVWAATGELPFSTSLYLRFDVSQQDSAVFISPLRSLFSAAATFLPPLSQCLLDLALPLSVSFPPGSMCVSAEWHHLRISSAAFIEPDFIDAAQLHKECYIMTLNYLIF